MAGARRSGRSSRQRSPLPLARAAARCSAVACVSWKPSGPVQALAPPELSTTARTGHPQDLAGPGHRSGLHPVGGEDGGGGP